MNFKKLHWAAQGLIWGYTSFILSEITKYLIFKTEVSMLTLFVGVIIWSLGGLGFGYTMQYLRDKRHISKK